MSKSHKFILCKCVKKICPMKYHVVQDPVLRSMISDEISSGIYIHTRIKSVVFIEII